MVTSPGPTIVQCTGPMPYRSATARPARRVGYRSQTLKGYYTPSLKPTSRNWRLGLPIVLTSGRRGPARPYSDEYAQRKVREARASAGLGPHVTLDACRHGGLTELGDAGATEFEGMAASMHKTPHALRLYVKRSEAQRMSAARKRRRLVEGGREG